MADEREELEALRKRVADLENRPAATKEPASRKPLGCGVIAGLLALAAILTVALFPKAEPEPKLSNGLSELDTRARAMIAVEDRLKDRGSAEFSEIHVLDIGGVVSACGDVNAKNGFGGYTGPKSFIVVGRVAYFASDLGSKTFNDMWAARCMGQKPH